MAEHYQANREAIRARQAEHYHSNRDAIQARRAENPHIYWGSLARHRAHGHGYDITVETFTRDELINRYGDQCFHCGGEWSELDHYPIPISRGGHHVIENCKPSCTPCNKTSWKENTQ